MSMIGKLRAALRCRRGAIAAEFAAMVPVLAIIALGVFEVSRFMIAIQKVDRIAVALADYVSQSQTITQPELDDLFDAVANIASPLTFDAGVVVVSSIFTSAANTPTTITWQRQGAGGLTAASLLGAQGGTATMPSGMTLAAGEGMVAAEAMMDYEPVFLHAFVEPIRIYRTAFYRPRKSQQVAFSGS